MVQQTKQAETRSGTRASTTSFDAGKFGVSLVGLIIVLALLTAGFIYLKNNSTGVSPLSAVVSIIWGVGGVGALYYTVNSLIESLPNIWRGRLLPYLFIGPAMALLIWVLTIPTIRTLIQSFQDANSEGFVGLDNYVFAFTNPSMLEAFLNNIIVWLLGGTILTVVLGLLIAVLADRSKFESIAKAIIFMPMAISLVGASVIWKFIYAYEPAGQQQIGILNALLSNFGIAPQDWLRVPFWNNFFLLVVQIWAGTGFAMVLFSAAIKGVPMDLQEAARVDGATEVQSFFNIVIPYIKGTIITVTTTTAIGTMKIFDVIFVMTGGNSGTGVVGTNFYEQFFSQHNYGHGSAIAIILFIAISPVLIYNLRQFSKQEGF